jgi:hypothetical protein
MSTPDDDELDPLDAHFYREPLPQAAVRVVVLGSAGQSHLVEHALAALLQERGRACRIVPAEVGDEGIGRAVEGALRGAAEPLLIVTDDCAPWTSAHLDPLLAAIERCDHVIGRRKANWRRSIGRWVATVPWRWVFAVPVDDVHSPYRLHRLGKLAAIPLQSASAFIDVEILGKATFLGHLMDVVNVPDPIAQRARVAWSDVVEVFKHPTFVHSPSCPAEDAEGEHESTDGPEGKNGHVGGDVEPPSAA